MDFVRCDMERILKRGNGWPFCWAEWIVSILFCLHNTFTVCFLLVFCTFILILSSEYPLLYVLGWTVCCCC